MGLLDRLFRGSGHGLEELARRLKVDQARLLEVEPYYHEFTIPKKRGGQRRILAPDSELKTLQTWILRRVLAGLKCHPAAMGFERGRSIVTNALPHQGRAVVIRMDVKDFFASTTVTRVQAYFRKVGWNRPAADLLTRLCTCDGGLPQGAPTSPRISNLVNVRLDARVTAMARRLGAVYTRYADDITISFGEDDRDAVHYLRRFVRTRFAEVGYAIHKRKKASVRRAHHQQQVCGLVVNQRVGLPRETRRWLRAVEHRARRQEAAQAAPSGSSGTAGSSGDGPGKPPTLTATQIQGWRALQSMVERQAGRG